MRRPGAGNKRTIFFCLVVRLCARYHGLRVKGPSLVLGILFLPLFTLGAKLSPLAKAPEWSRLDVFQQTITRDEFLDLLNRVYAPNGAWKDTISISDAGAVIKANPGDSTYLLRFAPSRAEAKAVHTYWRPRSQLPPQEPGKPLAGLKIALDPGHLGGAWAKMEERWFAIGSSKPVAEGDLTLYVAKLLADRLQALGAQVFFTRSHAGPVTALRPSQLKDEAKASLADKKTPATGDAVERESDLLFYRVGEIHRRAELVNERIRPDLVICLHFNAEPWGDEKNPTLVNENHLHFLVSGALSAEELSYDDQRFDMLLKLLSRSFAEELAVTNSVAKKMAAATGLPPYEYHSPNAIRVNDNPYIWARNLLANRLFDCPVVYAEPYVMNSKIVFARIQAGDYDGTKEFGGAKRKSIFREYADAIADGIVAYYSPRPL